MPRKYRTNPESLGLHPLGHAELANNGQRCQSCAWAGAPAICTHSTALGAHIKPEYRACVHYQARTHDDHAARLYRPEVTDI